MRELGRDQRGFTIIEVLVAIMILAIGAMTTFALLSAATRNAQRAKASQVALEYAEQEMEYMRSLENKQLAMTAVPPHSTNSQSPNFRVSEGTFALTKQPIGNYRNLVINGGSLYGGGSISGGTISPGPTPFTSGDVKGTVYRYIVWHNDEGCTETKCPGKQDYKQIVVAVKLDKVPSQSAEPGYVEVQSNFINPTENAESNPLPGGGGQVVTAQQFFLTDTPCSASGTTTREEITGDHLLHNTLGTCASGLKTGSKEVGAPDALLLGGPPDPAPEDPNNPPLYDYSSDSYLEPNPNTDKGVQLQRDTTSGCNYVPTGTTNPESQVHRWVTDPMKENFVMNEKVTLEFYTRTINDLLYNGKLCVYLFKRHESGSPPTASDTRLKNLAGSTLYWTYTPESGEFWPRYEWKKVRLTMFFTESPYTIPTGDRLGVALSAERSGTEELLPIMYDHPNYPTRIEVDTSTPINGG